MSPRAPVLATIAVLSFFAGFTGTRLAYTLAYLLILIQLVALIWSVSLARRLRVRRESPQGTYLVGEPFEESFTVENGSLFPLPFCEVHDLSSTEGYRPGRVCSLGSRDSVRWRARGVFDRRGRHSFGPLEARLGDSFGLFPRTVKLAPASEVVVFPALHPLDDVGLNWSGGSFDDSTHGNPSNVAPDVATVREYESGDGQSRIHWRSFARTGQLMSRVYDTHQSSDLLIALDLERGRHAGSAPESSLEYAVSIAASLAHIALRRGQAVGLVTNDAEATAFGAGRGEAQRLRLLEYLALCTDNGSQPLSELITRHGNGWRGRGGLVVITANRDRTWVESLLDVGSRGQRHLAVLIDAVSFGAPGPPARVATAWRLAADWRVVRRGDLVGTAPIRAATL